MVDDERAATTLAKPAISIKILPWVGAIELAIDIVEAATDLNKTK